MSRPVVPLAAVVLVLAALTVPLAMQHASLAVDPESRAMLSVGSPEHEALVDRRRALGDDRPVIALVEPAFPAGPLRDVLLDTPGVRAVPDPLYEEDGALALPILLGPEARGEHLAASLARVTRTLRTALPADARLSLVGQPAAQVAIARTVDEEQRRIVPWCIAALALILLAVHRHPGVVLAVLAPPTLGIVWLGGVYAWLGHRLDPISSLLEPVVLTVGVAGAVHLAEGYRARRASGLAPSAAARHTARDLLVPATLTVATTATGFLSLLVHDIPAVRRFGAFAALGTSLTCVLTFAVTPLLLATLAPGAARRLGEPLRTERAWIRGTRRLAVPIVALALVTGAGAAWLWSGIEVDTDPIAVLPDDHPHRAERARAVDVLDGVDAFEIWIPAESPANSADRLLDIEDRLYDTPGVAGIAETLRRAPDGLIVAALLEPAATTERARLFDELDAYLASLGAPAARVTGDVVRVARDSGRLVTSQVRAFGTTVLVLVVAGLVGFGSLRLALLGTLPNLLPCALIYGGLAAVGRPLSVASVMIGSVMLGLVVDDTIHLLYRYRRAREAGDDRDEALAAALHHAGRPVLVTSLALSGGFLAGLGGTLVTTQEFSVLATSAIVLALIADVVLVPAAIQIWPGRGRVRSPRAPLIAAPRLSWGLPALPLAIVAGILAVADVPTDAELDPPAAAAASAPPSFEESLAEWPALRRPSGTGDGALR